MEKELTPQSARESHEYWLQSNKGGAIAELPEATVAPAIRSAHRAEPARRAGVGASPECAEHDSAGEGRGREARRLCWSLAAGAIAAVPPAFHGVVALTRAQVDASGHGLRECGAARDRYRRR